MSAPKKAEKVHFDRVIQGVDKRAAGLSAQEVALAMIVASHLSVPRPTWGMTLDRLGAEVGLARRQTLRVVGELSKRGLLVVTKGGQHVANQYGLSAEKWASLPQLDKSASSVADDTSEDQSRSVVEDTSGTSSSVADDTPEVASPKPQGCHPRRSGVSPATLRGVVEDTLPISDPTSNPTSVFALAPSEHSAAKASAPKVRKRKEPKHTPDQIALHQSLTRTFVEGCAAHYKIEPSDVTVGVAGVMQLWALVELGPEKAQRIVERGIARGYDKLEMIARDRVKLLGEGSAPRSTSKASIGQESAKAQGKASAWKPAVGGPT